MKRVFHLNMKRRVAKGLRQQTGIALLEALIAVVLLGIGLVGTVGLQARAQTVLMQADMRAEATMASEKLIGIMNVNQGKSQVNLLTYAKTASAAPPAIMLEWHKQVMVRMPGATVEVAVTLDSPGMHRVDVTIAWKRKANDPIDQHTVTSYIAES
jgi:type IV pilus assembly protein PilV